MKLFIKIFFLIIFNALSVLSSNRIDSLEILLSSKSDYEKLKILDTLANIYCNSNLPRIGIEKADLAIKLSNKLHNNYYLGISYLHKANCLFDLLSYDSAITFFKSALKRLENFNAPLLTGNCLSNMGNTLAVLGKFTESISYYEKANEYYIKIGDNNRLANNYLNISSTKLYLFDFDGAVIELQKARDIFSKSKNNLGIINYYFYLSDIYQKQAYYDKAIDSLSKALDYINKLNDKVLLTRYYQTLGNCYENKTDYFNSIVNFFKSYNLYKEINNLPLMSQSLEGIALVYSGISYNDSAIKYFNISIAGYKLINDEKSLARVSVNLALVYEDRKEYDKALNLLESAKKIFLKYADIGAYTVVLNNTGAILNKLNKFNESFGNLDEAYKIAKKNNDIGILPQCCNNIGTIYLQKNNYKIAENFFREGLKYGNIIHNNVTLKESNKNLSIISAFYKDYKNAYKFESEYNRFTDSTAKEEGEKNIALLIFKKHLEDNEKAVEEAQKKIVLLNKDKEYQIVVRTSLIGGVGLFLSLAILSFLFFWRKKNDNKKLVENNLQIIQQKEVIEEKNRHITSSINYAKRIQNAILPFESRIKKAFPESFILYLPLAIVSGDFYWLSQTDDVIIFAVFDCTGHGVPGAFMSLIGNDLLNHIVNELNLTDTAKILEELHIGIRKSLKQESGESTQMDGMDIGIIKYIFDKENNTKTIEFAGANRPLFYATGNKSIIEIKGDRKSIGGRQREEYRSFTKHLLEFKNEENVMLYFTTDGYTDQNNEKEEKYGSRKFKELLGTISFKNPDEQKRIIEDDLKQFMGNVQQRDDITVVGIKC